MSSYPAADAPIRRSFTAAALLVAFGLALAGCASITAPSPLATPRPTARRVPPPETGGVASLAELPGWAEDDHVAAFLAFRRGCRVSRDPGVEAVCARARGMRRLDQTSTAAFFLANFRPEPLPGAGLLTAYFSPEYPARDRPDGVFSAPVRGRPADLPTRAPPGQSPVLSDAEAWSGGGALPYADRAAIDASPPDSALAWMRPEDLFMLQVQGSGGLVFEDGRRAKAVYAADNGRPFVAIAPIMVRQGLIAAGQASAETIRAWLAAHRGPEAEAIMDFDPRYVFFSLAPDDGRDPAGAAGVALPAGRAVAVDPTWHAYGEPLWIDAVSPVLAGALPAYRRLVMALDTGSAIKGEVRADLYLGRGAAAGAEAGRVRHTLLIVRLVPVTESAAAGQIDRYAR